MPGTWLFSVIDFVSSDSVNWENQKTYNIACLGTCRNTVIRKKKTHKLGMTDGPAALKKILLACFLLPSLLVGARSDRLAFFKEVTAVLDPGTVESSDEEVPSLVLGV